MITNDTKITAAIIQAIHRHPDPERACGVLENIMQRMGAGEDLETIEAMYAEDLAVMKGVQA